MLEEILNRMRYKKIEGSITNIFNSILVDGMPITVYDIKTENGKIIRAVNIKKIPNIEIGFNVTFYLERFPSLISELQSQEITSKSGIKRKEIKEKYLPEIIMYKV